MGLMALDSNDVARRMRMEILILHAFLKSPESSGVDLDAWDLVSHKLLMTRLYVIPPVVFSTGPVLKLDSQVL